MHERLIGLLGAGAFAAAAAGQHGPAPTWLVEFGTPRYDAATGLTPDGAGGVFVAGNTDGDFGGPSAGRSDAFVARYATDGEHLWTTQIGTEESEREVFVTRDGAGGAFATGSTFGSFTGIPRVDDSDIWLARLDAAGAVLWLEEFGAGQQDSVWGITSDGVGGAFLVGRAESSLEGGGGTGFGAFVTRYDAEGQRLWVEQFDPSEFAEALGVDSDGADGIFVGGATWGDPGDGVDALLARMDPDGNEIWTRQFGARGSDVVHSVAGDRTGGVFAAGKSTARGPFSEPENMFITLYDSEGNQLWLIEFGEALHDRALSAVSDGAGGVIVTGQAGSDLGGALAGPWDGFVLRCDGAGNITWITQIGAPEVRTSGQAIGLDGAGGLFAAGSAKPLYSDDGQAWLARFPLDAGCYADCDTSGELDLLDLLCFQDLFAAQAPRADCDLSGELDFFDLLCFQNAFAAGCP